MATKDIKININGKYNAKGAYNQATNDIGKLDKKIKKTDSSLKKGSKSMGAFGSKSANTSGKLKGLGQALGQFNPALGSMATKAGSGSGALAALGGSMGLVAGAAVAAGAAIVAFGVLSYQKAVASQAEWAKFKGVVESAGQSFDASKSQVKDFAMVSGRSVGEVRGAWQKLSAAGITPTGETMRNVSSLAIGLKTDMEGAATAYNRIVAGKGGRTLAQLGITMEEISTGGKVDTAKLNAILEQKFGKAGDNYANSAEAAGTRLQTAIDGLMVSFGNLLLGPGTMFQNALAWAISGITKLGGWFYNAFGGGEAFSGAMEFLTPVIDELSSALSDLMAEIFPNTKASGQLKPILTAVGAILAAFIRPIAMAIRVVATLVGATKNTAAWLTAAGRALSTAYRNSGAWIVGLGRRIDSLLRGAYTYLAGAWRNTGDFFRQLPGRAWSFISSGVSSFASSVRSAGQSLWNAIRGAPTWIYNSIVNAIPRINWPSWGDIAGWIKSMIWGSRGPGMGIGNVGSYIANQSALRTANLAAQRAALVSAYQQSAPAQQAASQATNNMGAFANSDSWFGPNGARGAGDWKERVGGMKFSYQDYGGSKQKAWDGSSNCMTGNCVDMSLGVLNAAAAAGARGGSLVFGSWNGTPHVWANIDGVNVDPARKALNGTFAPPARGPGGSSGNTYVFQAPVYDWEAFKKHVARAGDSIVGAVY